MTPRRLSLARSRLLSKALSASRAADGDAGDQRFDADAIVPPTRQQDEARQIAERIDKRDDFARQTAALITRLPDFESPFSAGAMLVDPDDRAVDHGVFEIRIAG